MIILLRVLNKALGLYIGTTFEIEKEDVPKEKYSFDHLVYTKEPSRLVGLFCRILEARFQDLKRREDF